MWVIVHHVIARSLHAGARVALPYPNVTGMLQMLQVCSLRVVPIVPRCYPPGPHQHSISNPSSLMTLAGPTIRKALQDAAGPDTDSVAKIVTALEKAGFDCDRDKAQGGFAELQGWALMLPPIDLAPRQMSLVSQAQRYGTSGKGGYTSSLAVPCCLCGTVFWTAEGWMDIWIVAWLPGLSASAPRTRYSHENHHTWDPPMACFSLLLCTVCGWV
jgi:hypothetical protein